MRCYNSRYCSDLQLVKISKKSFKANFSRCRILLYCKYRHAENIIKRFVYGSKTRIDWALKKSYTENRSLKCGIAENVDFRKCRISARTRTVHPRVIKKNSKLNEPHYFSVSFKLSLKCGIAGSVNFRNCRISARERTRISASFQKKTRS